MKIEVLTLFPEMFGPVFGTSILGRAQKDGKVTVRVHQLRDWATGKHKSVDDTPYGGGPGMVIKVDVVDRALKALVSDKRLAISDKKKRAYVILLTPQGKRFDQAMARKLAKKKHLILVAGHYEGFDERVRTLVDEEISIGDYVLTGGELPAMVLTDAVVRLLPGVLGDKNSTKEESFSPIALEYPHYTRPVTYQPKSIARKRPLAVPKILLSGNHAKISAWRNDQALARTKRRRSDLLTS